MRRRKSCDFTQLCFVFLSFCSVTLESFQKHPEIDAIEVVCIDGWHDVLRAYAKQFGIDNSFRSALSSLLPSDGKLLLLHHALHGLLHQQGDVALNPGLGGQVQLPQTLRISLFSWPLLQSGYTPGSVNAFLSAANSYLDYIGHREGPLPS
mgnify:CR=1 FL=1